MLARMMPRRVRFRGWPAAGALALAAVLTVLLAGVLATEAFGE